MQIKIDVCCLKEWELPRNAVAFSEWLQEQLATIPAQHRDDASIELTTEMEYEATNAYLSISYYREETDEERATREMMAKTWCCWYSPFHDGIFTSVSGGPVHFTRAWP